VGPRRSLRDEDLDAVIGAVLRATQAFVGLALRSLSAAGTSITLPQYRMLVTLDAKGDQNVRDLAAGLGVDRSTATRMCNRLVTAGLIDRTTDPSDRRAVVISLTGPGRSVVAAVTKSRRENVARLLRSVPPSRRVQLVDLLGEFAELAERDPG
jgi:DNA-binding MarR family transcriptional regulator